MHIHGYITKSQCVCELLLLPHMKLLYWKDTSNLECYVD